MSDENPSAKKPTDPGSSEEEKTIAYVGDFLREVADSIRSTNTSSSSWEPPTIEEVDEQFPEHRVEKLLGRGGMGAVYLATQLSLERKVAIKLLPPQMDELDPSFAKRFEREAKSMAQLDHPNIVTVFDYGRTKGGHYFFVMEYVDGVDFHHLIRSNQLDAASTLQAVSEVCSALEHAHKRGFVHRDIKPANILVNQEGTIKVGDFGLAKIVEGETGSGRSEPFMTMTGHGIGTPEYCAPEQIEGKEVDHRADIYSLGVMLYEMLTHELPRGNFLPPSQKVEIDIRLDDVVLKAMQSSPEHRYSSAQEMQSEVDRVRSNPGSTGSARESSKFTAREALSKFYKGAQFTATFAILILVGMVCYALMINSKSDKEKKTNVAKLPIVPDSERFRLVVIDTSGQPSYRQPDWLRSLKREDPDSILNMQLSQGWDGSPFPVLSTVHQNGKIEVKGAAGHESTAKLAPFEAARDHLFVPAGSGDWFALDQNGVLRFLGKNKNHIPPQKIAPLLDLSVEGNLVLALKSDGKLTSWGNIQQFSPDEKKLAEWADSQTGVTSLTPRGVVTRESGFEFFPGHGEKDRDLAIKTFLKGNSGFVRLQNGKIGALRKEFSETDVSLMGNPDSIEGVWRSESNHAESGALAVRLSDFRWKIFTTESDLTSENELAGRALRGAHKIAVWDSLIFALLPARAIPRSGFWDADELLTARRRHIDDPFDEHYIGPHLAEPLTEEELEKAYKGILVETRVYHADFKAFQAMNLTEKNSAGNRSKQLALQKFLQRDDVELVESNQVFSQPDLRSTMESIYELIYRTDDSELGAEVRNVGTTLEKSGIESGGYDFLMERVGYQFSVGSVLDVTPNGFAKTIPTFQTRKALGNLQPGSSGFSLLGTSRLGPPFRHKIEITVARLGERDAAETESENNQTFPDISPDRQIRPKGLPTDPLAEDDSDPFAGPNLLNDQGFDPFADPNADSADLPALPTGFLGEIKICRISTAQFRGFLSNPEFENKGLENEAILSAFLALPDLEITELISTEIQLNRREKMESITEIVYSTGPDPDTGKLRYETRNNGSVFEVDAVIESENYMSVYIVYERVTYDPWENSSYDTPIGALSMAPCFSTNRIVTGVLLRPNDRVFLGTMHPGPPAHDMVDILIFQIRSSEP